MEIPPYRLRYTVVSLSHRVVMVYLNKCMACAISYPPVLIILGIGRTGGSKSSSFLLLTYSEFLLTTMERKTC